MILKDIFSHNENGKPNQAKPRIQFIDLAKGICILLVLIDHCSIQTGVWVNHLRMPLYFILSGLFFKDYGSIMEFLRKKSNNILIPFITFYGVGLIYAILIDLLCHNDLSSYRISIPAFVHEGEINNYALWFLLALFWSNLIFWCISTAIRREWVRAIVIVLIAYLSNFINGETGHSYLFFGAALMNLPFFYIGYILKRTSILSGDAQWQSLLGGVLRC